MSRISAAFQSRQEQRRRSYGELIAAMVAGEDIPTDEAVQILADAGKTDVDLANDVKRAEQRRAWQQDIETGYAAEGKLADLQQRIETEVGAFAKIANQHAAVMTQLRQAEAGLTEQVRTAKAAQRQLLASAPAELTAQSRSLAEARQTVEQRRIAAQRRRDEIAGKIDSIRYRAQREYGPQHMPPPWQEEVASGERMLADVDQELAAIDAEATRLAEHGQQIRDAMLDAA